MIIKNENASIKNAFEKEEVSQEKEINANINLEGAEIETIQGTREDYTENNYNKKGNNYKNSDKYNYNDYSDNYDNYNYNNDKYYDKYNDNKYYKNKNKYYNNNDNYDYY